MNYIYIGIGLAAIVLLAIIIYRRKSSKKFEIVSDKVKPKASVVFLVKNNQKLLDYSFKTMIKVQKDIDEIVIIDIGSIDNSLKVAHEISNSDNRVKVYNIDEQLIIDNYFNIIKNYVTGEVFFIIDLNKIGMNNPNVYTPDIFKPLESAFKNQFSNIDDRIDGTNLLYFDKFERQKNTCIVKENIIETLSNIRMMVELYEKDIQNGSEKIKNTELLDYIDRSTRNVTLLTRFLGSVEFNEKNINDNILTIFKDYSQSHGVSVDYEVKGKEIAFKDTVNNLILQIIEEILYIVVHNNLTTKTNIKTVYNKDYFEMNFEFKWNIEEDEFLSPNSGLRYYVLQSIQNRLKFIDGYLNIKKAKSLENVVLIIKFPIDDRVCSKGEDEKNEKI